MTVRVVGLVERYCSAMKRGDTDTCIRIELDTGLFGYPPEWVTVGLQAIDSGKDGFLAIEEYIDGQSPTTPDDAGGRVK